MCAWSRDNNQAPNLATLLQGTASTPAGVIDSSPSPGGRGHGRAPDPPRRPPRTQHGPTRRADTRAGNPRDRRAVQGVAADPSASRAGRASAVRDDPARCREPRGARPRHRRARHAGPPAREHRGSRPPVAPGSSPPRRARATASPGRVRAAEAWIASGSGLFRTAARRGWRGRTAARSRTGDRRSAVTRRDRRTAAGRDTPPSPPPPTRLARRCSRSSGGGPPAGAAHNAGPATRRRTTRACGRSRQPAGAWSPPSRPCSGRSSTRTWWWWWRARQTRTA